MTADHTDQDDDSYPTEQTEAPPEESTAAKVGAALTWPLRWTWTVLYLVAFGVLSKLPKRSAVYRKMVTKGYENLWRNTDGHFVANTIYGDGAMVPRPAQIDTDEQTVETNNGEQWTATAGVETVRIGDTPVAFGVADHHEMVDPIAARIAEAIDYSPRRQQTVEETDVGYRPVEYADPLEQAMRGATGTGDEIRADGGAAGQADLAAEIERRAGELLDDLLPRRCTFSDVWLDASNPNPANDGWIISMEKAYEVHWDQAASEEMKKQEDRGRLAEMDPDANRRQQLYYALIGLGGVALGLFGPALAQQIAGSASGAAGGVNVPIVIGHLAGVI